MHLTLSVGYRLFNQKDYLKMELIYGICVRPDEPSLAFLFIIFEDSFPVCPLLLLLLLMTPASVSVRKVWAAALCSFVTNGLVCSAVAADAVGVELSVVGLVALGIL